MTKEQKKEIEKRLNKMNEHGNRVAFEYQFNSINFVLNTLGYYAEWEFDEYKIKKQSY